MRAWVWLVCVSAAAQPLTSPSWLVPYPGAKAETRTMASLIETTYQTNAASAKVVAHYGKLFEDAGLPFAPSFDGMGTVVRASPPECDVMLKIREQDGGAFVRVSCAVKTAAMVAAPTPPPAPKVTTTSRAPVWDSEQARRDSVAAEMRKYDEPVQTRPRSAPTWPSWLVDPAGKAPPIRRTAAESTFLSASFAVAAEVPQIRDFYAALLESHGCPITGRGKTWLESSCKLDPRSIKQLIIRAEMSPAEGGMQVQLRVSSIP